MLRTNNKNSSFTVTPPKVSNSRKKVTGVSMPRTSYGRPRTFLLSPSGRRNNTLSSTGVFTKQTTLTSKKRKSVLTTVSTGLKQQAPPGLIDMGFGFEIPDGISDLDGLAKIIQPNLTASADTSIFFDEQFRSSSVPTTITNPFVTSHSSSSIYNPSQSSANVNSHSSLKSPPSSYPSTTHSSSIIYNPSQSSANVRSHSSLKSPPPSYPSTTNPTKKRTRRRRLLKGKALKGKKSSVATSITADPTYQMSFSSQTFTPSLVLLPHHVLEYPSPPLQILLDISTVKTIIRSLKYCHQANAGVS